MATAHPVGSMERPAERPAVRLLQRWQVGSQPVLVVGHGRSGTTWVGQVLARCRRALYYHEPCSPGRTGGCFDTWFRYVRAGARDPKVLEPPLDAAFGGLPIAGRRWHRPRWHRLLPGYRIVVKEVTALMSVEWIAVRYRPKVVIVVRHPCSVILSELQQGTLADRSIEALLRQRELFEDHLEPYRSVIERASTPIEKLGVIWAARYRVVVNAMRRHRGWLRIFYEPLCVNPQGVFHDLVRLLGLTWTKELEKYVEYSSSTEVPDLYAGVRISRLQVDRWKQKMGAKEALSVKRIVELFELPFYRSEEYWTL